ncbi:MAG TPA: hypothetical protein VFU05_19810 [Cyclobacteriaceae bacterium]|nr:hypothetical protein [Cyclobacteriaceae bacterium]
MSQVIKKRRIVLASVLKPVDDTRMFEKLGPTLAADKTNEVSIIGYTSTAKPIHPDIHLIQLPPFGRMSFKRLLMPWIIFSRINKVDPEVIIINTPELLLIAVLSKIIYGRKIVYDVLENYYQTIRFTSTYPFLVRSMLAVGVRIIEVMTSPLVHHFLLAEVGYISELNFAKPHTIHQNKLPRSIASSYFNKRVRGNSKLIFTGTLALFSGVFDAIKLGKGLHQLDNSYSLTIIGYCAIPETLAEIRNEIKDSPFITLIGGDALVPHHQILEEISHADFGIIIYPPNPSTQTSIPTKLFEYLALRLPVLIRHNAESHQLVEKCQGGIVLEETINYSQLSEALKNQRSIPMAPDHIFWEKEAENLIGCLNLK